MTVVDLMAALENEFGVQIPEEYERKGHPADHSSRLGRRTVCDPPGCREHCWHGTGSAP
ncbi:hypothetical protein SAM23877_7612 [Streptomyces ambofaciens ATCC 23877]|uniref:Uncharacterized protein n=1 Tax=Streptomyces ambofaciens (strain ATCC 23877 / 3486 / DSM 40053 / JCM 4204 / NBRC 12836 / NRRL B-2516) TaxID=278992 RepID=A0A0K2AJE1_STRA7|nr:hypothetical protein SAM23877_0060 [Streptomyces ambofaciens ATCC 23877]AKZ60653.1 hypothetical protein SAM23877_7612 [Streptomyces ambofaciens ATCC 23877]